MLKSMYEHLMKTAPEMNWLIKYTAPNIKCLIKQTAPNIKCLICLLYTSDAADE